MDELDATVQRQRARLAKLERKHATVKGDLRRLQADRGTALADRDHALTRVEDLEEALRRIVCVLQSDGRHDVTDRDAAVLAVALDVLGLEQLARHGCPHGAHPDCPHETTSDVQEQPRGERRHP